MKDLILKKNKIKWLHHTDWSKSMQNFVVPGLSLLRPWHRESWTSYNCFENTLKSLLILLCFTQNEFFKILKGRYRICIGEKKLRWNLSLVAFKILHRIAISVFEKNACLPQWGENSKIEYMGEIGKNIFSQD